MLAGILTHRLLLVSIYIDRHTLPETLFAQNLQMICTNNLLAASAWNGYSMARGTCTVHAFNGTNDDEGDPELGDSVNESLRSDPETFFQSNYLVD